MLRPRPIAALPSPDDLEAVTAVLDEPDGALLPVTDDLDGERVIDAARIDEKLERDDIVLGVATTGSTGTPKIVLHTAKSLRASIDATAQVTGGHGQWLLCLGINHIAGIQVVLRSAQAGAMPVVTPTGGPSFIPEFIAGTRQLTRERRYVSMVPTQLARVLADDEALKALTSFDALLLGGAAADPALLQRSRDAGVNVITTYGMSETAGGCVYDGVPLPGVEIGTDDGIVTLTGDVVAAGYRDRVEPYPFHGRTFTTSDLGEVVDGELRILGRADDIINTGGKKVSPIRVEQALRTLAEIDDAIVIGVPDERWGSRVVALVTGQTQHLETVRDALRTSLARHELPTELRYIDELPYRGIGKPDRSAALRLVD